MVKEFFVFVAGLLGGFLIGVLFHTLCISVIEAKKDNEAKKEIEKILN